MKPISIHSNFLKGFVTHTDFARFSGIAEQAYSTLLKKNGAGSEFLGWVDLPSSIQSSEIKRISDAASLIHSHSEYLVVIGIGGSYLGAKAIIEAHSSMFDTGTKKTKIIFAGHHIDSDYHHQLLNFLKDKDFSVNVISKSGTTTEPALAFRFLLDLLEKKYGKENLKNRVFSTTDSKKGSLKKLSDEYGFPTYVIPDDVGGRFSVLTPVGLLPIAVAGIDIQKLVDGAVAMEADLKATSDPKKNLAIQYATYRNILYSLGKKLEVMVNYNPRLQYFSEWWKQLYGESEGKSRKGIFTAGVSFTTDLHSLGQYIQDGERMLFETLISVEKPDAEVTVSPVNGDPDGLNYIAGKSLSYINSKAIEGTKLAHYEGGVPIIEISIPSLDPYYTGQLIYLFEFACGISGYMLGVNPFDQPGVEDYKNNMFALLGKKGYEEKKKEVESKLSELGK
jgi:glucose-6-phosphate isomerase